MSAPRIFSPSSDPPAHEFRHRTIRQGSWLGCPPPHGNFCRNPLTERAKDTQFRLIRTQFLLRNARQKFVLARLRHENV
jgi:hypothetical protein